MQEHVTYTKDDFTGTTPYEAVYRFKDQPFSHQQALERMDEIARGVGYKGFKTAYAKYVSEQKKILKACNFSAFDHQPMELATGQWLADEDGIRAVGSEGSDAIVSLQPVLPVQRLVNLDTGTEKIQLAFRRGDVWKSVIVDRHTIASAQQIVKLANEGLNVTSENARAMVRFLNDLQALNFDRIPESKSISRLGWVEGKGFMPYADGVVFDGEQRFLSLFKSVRPHGALDAWVASMRQARMHSVGARMTLAAAFASVLVGPLQCLPFFVHLWGGTGVGKSVALMAAASVWADPLIGRYIQTFNSTAVSRELTAAFVNNLPLLLDELQIISDQQKFDQIIYMLCEGVSRGRGNRNGGLQDNVTWRNCILTTGEQPIAKLTSAGGMLNRIVEVECLDRLYDDLVGTAHFVQEHYGVAGPAFVQKLQEDGAMDLARETYQTYYQIISKGNVSEKQAMAAALILTADFLADLWLFRDGWHLLPEELDPYLHSNESLSAGRRAYEYLCAFVVQNANRFCGRSDTVEVWGKFDGTTVYVVANAFNRICNEAGFDPMATRSWLKQRGLLRCDANRLTKKAWINNHTVTCVTFQLNEAETNALDM